MTAKFTVQGEPRGKGRPRFVRIGNYVSTYTDKKTVAYQERIKTEYKQQCRGIRFPDGEILDLRIIAYYAIPKSATKGDKLGMECGIIRPTKTPDADNVIKSVGDALNNLAYRDDSQVVDCQFRKYYSHRPRIEVTIKKANNGRKEIS